MKNNSWAVVTLLQVGFLLGSLCLPSRTHAAMVATWGDISSAKGQPPNGLRDAKAIAGGARHSLALRTDGTVVAWGRGDSGETNVPSGLSGVVAIAAGGNHSHALKADGTMVAWGAYGSDFHVAGITNVKAIAAGWYHWLGLKGDGTLVTWGAGNNSYNPTNIPPGLSNVIAIAAGIEFSVALRSDGAVVAWGWNAYNQTNVPVGLSNVVGIAAGAGHGLAVRTDGTVVAWGANWEGQINVPPGLSNVVAVAAGHSHSIALKADGTVVAWGNAIGSYPNFGQSVVPADLRNVTAIAAGGEHNLALVPDGPPQILVNPQSQEVAYLSNVVFSVTATGGAPLSYQWFRNGVALAETARIPGTTNATLTIANALISDTGTFTVVVSNSLGRVVSRDATLRVIYPPTITAQSPDQTVRAGADALFAVSVEGAPTLRYQWFFNGNILSGKTTSSINFFDAQVTNSGVYSVLVTNDYGQARAFSSLTVTDSAPYILTQLNFSDPQNPRMTTNLAAAVGASATLRISARGSLPLSYQWRFNGGDIPGATNAILALNQLRYDQTGFYNVVISNPFGSSISTKAYLSVAQVLVWGNSPLGGTTNVPSGLTNAVAVAAGLYHISVLKSDGRVATWTPDNRPLAVTNVPITVTNVAAIAVSGSSSMALRANGSVVVWGDNPSNINNVPGSVSNVMAIALGSSHCLALRSNGVVVSWGNNSGGQANIPAGLSNVVGIAAGNSHSLALKAEGTVVGWGNNANGQLNIPTNLSGVIAVAAWGASSFALRSNGTVAAWGMQYDTVPTGLSNVVAMTARYNPTVLRRDGSIVSWGFAQPPNQPILTNVIAVASGGEFDGFTVALIGNGSPVVTIQPVTQTSAQGDAVRLHARAAGWQPMTYQWQLNGGNLAGATNASLIITNVQGKDTGGYRMIISNTLGSAVSAIARVTLPYATNLAAALSATEMVWTTGLTNAAWFAQIQETHDGAAAAQSGPITHDQQSHLQTAKFPGFQSGTLTFWWKVSSEEGFDFLKFHVDQSPVPLMSISGETLWQKQSIHVGAGEHSFQWIYAKDGSVSDGKDAGWVDEVEFTPDAPVISQQPTPTNMVAAMGNNVSFNVNVSGGGVTYQWLKNGEALSGGTDAFLRLTNVTRRSSGAYAVRAANAGGSVLSSNTLLQVRVPQRLRAPVRLADGSCVVVSGDADGRALLTEDLAGFEVQTSTDLVNWAKMPMALTLTNGSLRFQDPYGANVPERFYRILER